jgi:hypothetical protein
MFLDGILFWVAICLFGIGISLTLISLRQRRQTRILKDLGNQNHVSFYNKYGDLGVGLLGEKQVLKCPSCAEWVNIEAKLCKYCKSDVFDSFSVILEAIEKRKADELAQRENAARNREEVIALRRERIIKIAKNYKLSIPVVICLILSLFLSGRYLYNNHQESTILERVSRNEFEAVQKWQEYLEQCGVNYYVFQNSGRYAKEGTPFHLDILLGVDAVENFNWSSPRGKQIDCFTKRALNLKISKDADWENRVDEWISYVLDVYTSDFGTPSLVIRTSD